MRDNRKVKRQLRWFLIAVLVPAMYLLGIGTAVYQIPPYKLLAALHMMIRSSGVEERSSGVEERSSGVEERSSGDAELLRFAFTDLVGAGGTYFPPVKSLEDLQALNEGIRVPAFEFDRAFDQIILGEVQQLTDQVGRRILKVSFRVYGKDFEAFAYGAKPRSCRTNRVSALVIPGSGLNQSSAILDRDESNYHAGLLPVLDKFDVDTFVFIKPNEDFLAWTNGSGRKVNGDFIYNWHLNRGGSYSASYLVQAIAVQKYLDSCFEKTMIAGLSQGGFASLLVALQSTPTSVVVASGFTVLTQTIEWSGPQQIVGLPRQSDLYDPGNIRSLLRESPSNWFFSWGLNEEGTYRVEALKKPTASAIGQLNNVETVIHSGSHVFPVEEIEDWLLRANDATRELDR